MKIHTLILGEIAENCYIIEAQSKNAVIIDCGDEAERVLSFIQKNGLTVKKILLTHGHFDHMNAVSEVVKNTGAEVFIHKNDAPMLLSPNLSLAYFMPAMKFNPVLNYKTIADGDVIIQDELEFKVLHTPGHTLGGACYICENAIFSGDTLFAGTVGRTDFPGGSFEEIKKSVDRIADLEGNFDVYCGHGEATTLDIERKTNMYLKGNYDDNSF